MARAHRGSAGGVLTPPAELSSGRDVLPLNRALEIHRVMAVSRRLEERCIKMSKSGEAYFWVGGPGESNRDET